jgi:outer membrane protein OmpA-like peptidoglycan-associated protein
VFFDFNSAILSAESRSVAVEGGKIFKLENYRLIVLRGFAARSELNGTILAPARAAVVREALIQAGIDPSVIVIEPGAVTAPEEIQGSYWLNCRVIVDFSD